MCSCPALPSMPQLSSYSSSRAPRSLPFRLLSPSDHFLPKATLTQGTIIKCASISLTSLQPLISSSPVPGPLPGLFPFYPVFRSNPHEGDSRPRPQSDFQSLQQCDFPFGPNIPKHCSRAPEMNPKLVGAGAPGASLPPPSGRAYAVPPSRPPASLPGPSAACARRWSAPSLVKQGCLGLQEDKGHLLRTAEARHP